MEFAEVASGQRGFVIRGESERDRSGRSVSGAGAVNGDGLADLLIGAPYADLTRRARGGACHFVFAPRGEDTPRFRRGEVNGDERVDLSDPVGTRNFLFAGGNATPVPGPSVCGWDPTTDDPLGCEHPTPDCR